MSPQSKPRKLPHRWRITLTILTLVLIPYIILASVFYKNAREEWISSALSTYYNEAETSGLHLSNTFSEMQSKMHYLANNSTIRTLISRVEYLTLPLAIDMIDELENAVSAITVDSPALVVRWYPLKTDRTYGTYCYPFQLFKDEFDSNNASDALLYQSIIDSTLNTPLWAVRNISRSANNMGPIEQRLCLYTLVGDYSVADCLLELSFPVDHCISFDHAEQAQSILIAFSIPQDDRCFYLYQSNPAAPDSSDMLLSQYQRSGKIAGYDIVRTPLTGAGNAVIIWALASDYISLLIQPQLLLFVFIAALVIVVLAYVIYLSAKLMTRQYEINNLRMELELLQLRFNPHLLYNTLNALCCQIRNPSTVSIVASLCRYYRIVLNNGYLIIKVRDEISMIKEYLRIETFAYALEQIHIAFDIDEEILECSIIKHILQPIVENAIQHGLRPLDRDGVLFIRIKPDGQFISFEISDNGIGMSAEQIRTLLSPPKPGTNCGYGVYNVQQRIHTYYGKKYNLCIESNPEHGTSVTFRLPSTPPAL